MTQELNLLVEAINNGEAEGEGIKFIVMDENTIYRFENNKMKKVSATLLKRAKKIIQDSDKPAAQPKPKRATKAKKAVDVEEEEQEPEDEPEPEPEEVIKPIKPKRTTKPATPKKPANSAYEIDLNEYWHTKNKLEFMELENTRLNNKVSKLKQYKGVLNKLMGSEYEPTPTLISSSQASQQPQFTSNETSKKYNDSLFMF